MASILVGVTILFCIAWCATSLLPRASAASRHVIWTCTFAAVLLLAPVRWRAPHRAIAPALPAIAATTVVVTPSTGGAAIDPRVIDPRTIFLGLWALGSAVMVLRLLRNALQLRSIVRAAHGRPPILISSRIRGPLVVGLLRPVILLPCSADTWTVSRRRAVLAHEAAHIRRRDPLILFAAQLATALYWFHPLCWLAAARLRAESERACDDTALRIGLLPSDYAGHLLDLARKFNPQLAIPMATTSHLESRVKSILDPETNRSFPAAGAWFRAIALTGAILVPLSTLTLRAQRGPGTAGIAGVVVDATGARVPRAQLTATNSDAGNREVTTSGLNGLYSFDNIPAGHYTIQVQAIGFQTFNLANLVLVNGGRLQADAHLDVGNLTEQITISRDGVRRPQAIETNPKPIRVGGNVQAANIIQQVKPVYPADLQTQGIEGTVLLRATISKAGVPLSLSVQNTAVNQQFVIAALDAVSQWRYRPALLNGEPIEAVTTIDVDFRLSGQPAVVDDRLLKNAITK
jgi:TonB family protein